MVVGVRAMVVGVSGGSERWCLEGAVAGADEAIGLGGRLAEPQPKATFLMFYHPSLDLRQNQK